MGKGRDHFLSCSVTEISKSFVCIYFPLIKKKIKNNRNSRNSERVSNSTRTNTCSSFKNTLQGDRPAFYARMAAPTGGKSVPSHHGQPCLKVLPVTCPLAHHLAWKSGACEGENPSSGIKEGAAGCARLSHAGKFAGLLLTLKIVIEPFLVPTLALSIPKSWKQWAQRSLWNSLESTTHSPGRCSAGPPSTVSSMCWAPALPAKAFSFWGGRGDFPWEAQASSEKINGEKHSLFPAGMLHSQPREPIKQLLWPKITWIALKLWAGCIFFFSFFLPLLPFKIKLPSLGEFFSLLRKMCWQSLPVPFSHFLAVQNIFRIKKDTPKTKTFSSCTPGCAAKVSLVSKPGEFYP